MEDIRRVDDHGDTYSIPYDPGARKTHRWEGLFLDIPMTMVRDPAGIWQPSPGAIMLPHTAARIAEHVELCGFALDDQAAQIRRVDLPRGAHRWQDTRSPVPDIDPVDKVREVATAVLTTSEKQALIERLQADIDDIHLEEEQS